MLDYEIFASSTEKKSQKESGTKERLEENMKKYKAFWETGQSLQAFLKERSRFLIILLEIHASRFQKKVQKAKEVKKKGKELVKKLNRFWNLQKSSNNLSEGKKAEKENGKRN